MDLLELLGDDWAPPAPPCSAGDRLDATHGCRHCGRAPRRWSEAYGAYIDGMGRITKCGHCPSCGGSGWTLLRDPWTDMPVSNWWEVPCQWCYGGYSYHAWDCAGHPDEAYKLEPRTVTAWGIGSRRVTYLPGEVVAPDPRLCTNHNEQEQSDG